MFVSLPVFAQEHRHSCGTDEYYTMMLKKHPELAAREAEHNAKARAAAAEPNRRAAIYTIPVVFHVIHTNGPENISREQILDQMRVLNQDFNFLNPNRSRIRSQFLNVAADCQIQFKLATVAPDGSCTDGINRVYSPLGGEVDQADAQVKDLVRWDYRKYLNVWVVTSIKSTGNGTILGYAVFPWMNNASEDGIVIRHDRVGTLGTAIPSDSARTLTHEVGHWLGLLHTFQGGCADDDQCDDTPPVASTFTNANCPANGNSCNEANDLPDQWENYMDYSEGRCMAMFTRDQKSRMHYFLSVQPRSSNWSSANLLATGVSTSASVAPVAAFASSHRIVCTGQPVTFYDISCKGTVTARSWTLTGSSSPSSTAMNPVVVYQTPGKYTVSLTVQNARGGNTKTETEFIEVISISNANFPNIEEGFEDDPNARGFRHLSPAQSRWELTNTVAYTGNQCYRAPVGSTDQVGTVYSFRTGSFDLTRLRGLNSRFTFYCAYAQASTESTEVLRVFVSTDCGNSFRQILERSASGLAYTGAPVTANFVPATRSQWKLMGMPSLASISLDTARNAIFRIDVLSAGGNPVYIDNLNISQWFAGTEQTDAGNMTMRLYPNPAETRANLEIDLRAAGQVRLELIDLQGRVISVVSEKVLQPGTHTFIVDKPAGISGGLCMLRVTTPFGSATKPLTFAP